ncbi:uncharacterized protein LOC113239145 [Hyposmocoma kahamanoa]|uniref:uncharacterized protein LOC113239145 n=1 Tax=Hyposmocoma kahamanoa TaxID=1477025 RepID=UPI000E6D9714|nr:uncharacterized protein LOC113239145 [Hyposmocoma kahamanoa]
MSVSRPSMVEVGVLPDCGSESERMVSASSDEESTLSEGRSRSGSAGQEGSSRATKRAAPQSGEPLEPEVAPKINTARRGRPRVPGKTYPGAAVAGRGRSSSAEWNALQKEADATFYKEALRGPGQVGEAEPEGAAGFVRESLAQEARDGLAAILAETAKSSNLKGTVVKTIKEAVRKVEGAVDFLHRGETATEAARRMSEDNRRTRGQLAALGAEVKALRGAYSSAMAKAKAQVAPPPCSFAEMHAGVREAIDDLRRDIFTSMKNMVDARLCDIERRLPAETLRPSLGGKRGTPVPEAALTAAASAAASRMPPAVAASEPTPGPSLARDAPAGPRPKKAKKAAKPKAPAAPSVAAPAIPVVPGMAAPVATTGTPWSQVLGRKAKKAAKAAATSQAARAPTKAAPKTATKPRALATPKSSAVVITLRPDAVKEKGATYRGILEAATAAIDLGSLGIPTVRMRNTQTGARMIEVPGATSAKKADALASKIIELVGGLAMVSRPSKTADLRVAGLDETATPEKVRDAVAAKGQCPPSEVSVGAVRHDPNGRGSALVRCPVRAAQLVVAAGRLQMGWTSAGVQVLEPRPMRCYKCMGIGHTRALCPSPMDRSALCLRCGQEGHQAASCSAAPKCAVCTSARRPAEHIMRGLSCAPPPSRGKVMGATSPPPNQTSEGATMEH